MAFVMGRSYGYGVHLRSCFPSVTSSSGPPNSLSSLSCLASCFFLRFSSSSCRNRKLKLCVAPPLALSRPAFLVHGEAEQERSSPSSAYGLQQSHALKQASSRKKEMEEGAEVKSSNEVICLDAQMSHASLPEDASPALLLSARSKVKATRRKKADAVTPSKASEDGLAGDEKPAVSKRTGKKTVVPDNGSMDVATVLAEDRVPSKLSPRRKRSKSAEFEDIVKASTLDESSPLQVAPSDAASLTPKKATRKKKVPEEESTMSTGRKEKTFKEKQKAVEEGSHAGCENIAKSATSVKRARNKKTSALLSAQEESSLHAKQVCPPEETNKPLNLKPETSMLHEEHIKPKGRKRLSLRAKEAALNLSEVDAALPAVSLGTTLTAEEPSIGSGANVLAVKEIKNESSPRRKRRASKAKESTSQITSAGSLSTLEPYLSQEIRNVENSVDKASLTDEMPVLSVIDSHTTSRRRPLEALPLPKDLDLGNHAITESGTGKMLTDTTEAFPEQLPLLEDSAVKSFGALEAKEEDIGRFKSSMSLNISGEQVNKIESETFHKASFTNDADQKWVVPRGLPYKEDPTFQRSKPTNSEGTFRVPGNYPPTSRWTEKANNLKESPVSTQRWAPQKQGNMFRVWDKSNQSRGNINSQQWAQWKKSDTVIKDAAKGSVIQVNERTSSVQFKTTGQNDRDMQQGYNLANIDRFYGKEHKKKKEFSVRKVVANQASTTSYMQIFGTGFDTGDTMPTVLLFFDRRRFIFNVGEGLHRFCMEHRFKLSKIDHVFLTRVCSETTGGLPGLILTLADLGESGLTAQTWGPSSLQDLAEAMRTFVPSGWMEHTHCFSVGDNRCTLIEKSSSPPILLLEDELIKISAVLLHPENKTNLSLESDSSEERIGGVISTVYICELAVVRGKFDPEKAQAKGLKPGYKYGKLQKGESVMSDDGTLMVHPEDVLGPSSPGPIMVLVDCPSSAYIASLTSSMSLQSYFSQTGKIVNCMIHIGPRSVTRLKEYQSWMENFREAHHIMARKDVKVLGTPTLRYSAKLLSKLNLVCPQLFPILEPDVMNQKEALNDHMVDGGNLLKYHFRPLTDLGPNGSEVPESFNHVAAQKYWKTENLEVMRAQELAGQVMNRWTQMGSSSSTWEDKGLKECQKLPACLDHVSRDEMELVFLGTGSSQPAKHRNVTGIYIHLYERGGILLDCGEGTYAQLKRRYGAKGADDVLMGLKCIWISHMHADHFSGIARILSARRQLLQAQSVLEPILVVGPRRLKLFLGAYQEIEDLGMTFLDCSQTTSEVQSWVSEKNSGKRDGTAAQKRMGLVGTSLGSDPGKRGMQHVWKRPGFHTQQGIDVAGRESLRMVLNRLGLRDLCSVPVVHCPHAFAVVLEAEGRKISESNTRPGWKLVFSGDTRPCQALVEAAHGATILIHEATFDDELIAEAVKKNHSITNEAIQVGVAAQVYRIFLTHFSQRYPIIPSFDNRFSDRTCIAFDMMSVNLADLPIVPELVPALQLLFRDQTEVEEDLAVSV